MSAVPDHLLDVDPAAISRGYNVEPFGLGHGLHRLDLFAFDALIDLARLYEGHDVDYFVAPSAQAAAAAAAFYDAPPLRLPPHEAIAELGASPTRVLMKRPENYHPGSGAARYAVPGNLHAARRAAR